MNKVLKVLLNSLTVAFLFAFSLLIGSCGGADDDCVDCNINGDVQAECPAITKQCSFGTITVNQCSGSAGGNKGCCATSPDEISCNFVSAYKWDGSYEIKNGVILFQLIDFEHTMSVQIDPILNGWTDSLMDKTEAEAIIADKMAEAYLIAQ